GPAQGAAPPLRLAPGDAHRAHRRKGHRPARRPWAGQGLRRPLHDHRRPARRPRPPRREIRREPRTGDRGLADTGAGAPPERPRHPPRGRARGAAPRLPLRQPREGREGAGGRAGRGARRGRDDRALGPSLLRRPDQPRAHQEAGGRRRRDRRARDGRRATAPRGQDLRPHGYPHDAHARRRARGDRAAGRARDRLRVEDDRLRRGGRVAGWQGGRRATSGGDDARRERIPRAGGRAMKPSRVFTVLAAAVVDGRLFVAGGYAGRVGWTPLATVYEYDAARNSWATRAPLRTPRGALALVALDGRLHAVGGSGASATGAHEIYDPATDR